MEGAADGIRLDGLAALVTGGASGIGLATARLLVARGASVAVLDRDAADVPAPLHAVRADVADERQVEKAVAAAVDHLGRLDIVVNNAGIGAQGTVEDNPSDEWRAVHAVNVLGMVHVSRAALPHLRESRSAAIVNTCSIAATAGLPQRALYSATKGAVQSLTLAMAADHLREGIRVNCVNPGTADTPWVGRLLDAAADPAAERAALEARQPMGRLVSAEEVAHAIAYLASPAAAATTGTVLAVDGGMQGLRVRGPEPEPARLSRVALHTRLRPGAEEAYEQAHREVPDELVAAIRAAGAREWTIWRSGPDLFHVVVCEDYARLLSELEHLPVNIAWQARMAELLEVVHNHSSSGADGGLPVVWEL
jgi:NAD(P)-dependent dehydrogenase (short-subunit alcohol dehydrogenase family)/L-rhamnose mutarotase